MDGNSGNKGDGTKRGPDPMVLGSLFFTKKKDEKEEGVWTVATNKSKRPHGNKEHQGQQGTPRSPPESPERYKHKKAHNHTVTNTQSQTACAPVVAVEHCVPNRESAPALGSSVPTVSREPIANLDSKSLAEAVDGKSKASDPAKMEEVIATRNKKGEWAGEYGDDEAVVRVMKVSLAEARKSGVGGLLSSSSNQRGTQAGDAATSQQLADPLNDPQRLQDGLPPHSSPVPKPQSSQTGSPSLVAVAPEQPVPAGLPMEEMCLQMKEIMEQVKVLKAMVNQLTADNAKLRSEKAIEKGPHKPDGAGVHRAAAPTFFHNRPPDQGPAPARPAHTAPGVRSDRPAWGRRAEECFPFQTTGECPKGVECAYQHSKKKVCFQFALHRKCRFGDDCFYAHEGALPPKLAGICWIWERNDGAGCRFGAACRYQHPTPSVSNKMDLDDVSPPPPPAHVPIAPAPQKIADEVVPPPPPAQVPIAPAPQKKEAAAKVPLAPQPSKMAPQGIEALSEASLIMQRIPVLKLLDGGAVADDMEKTCKLQLRQAGVTEAMLQQLMIRIDQARESATFTGPIKDITAAAQKCKDAGWFFSTWRTTMMVC